MALERLEGLGIDRQKTFSLDAFPLPARAVGLAMADVTEAAMVAAALRRQALHDGLTGLPNRTLLRDRLQYALADARRRNERVALILLDLNHFKEVNDALGHQYGDRLLVAFAKRLQSLLRECDTIARLGGDEFALLLTHATNEGASRVVTKVSSAMQEPFELDGVTVQTTASLGVALFPDHAEDADLLTQRADVAMYNAKRGGGGWAIYSPAQDQSSVERLTLLSALHTELEDGAPEELTLHYQPILDLHTDQITGAEALLRWEHPTLGWLDPELVVELAELSGLIQPLARFVAREAMAVTSNWLQHGHELRIAVNLSARNLYDRNLVTWLQDTMHAMGLPTHLLKCELTESEVMDDPVLALDVISRLREIGVHTAIDDFGTGYSSLSYLRRLPVDEIKIDKSFVMSMLEDRHDMTIVRTVIDLAHNLDMAVLAEGVEDEATLGKLREFGCDRVQGYLVGKPMPAEELSTLLCQRLSQHDG
jgi:diguanylate cyclase (GGDEF)-like protein